MLPDLYPEFAILPRKTQILRAQQDIVAKLYGNYLQGGHGNFHAPFLDVFFANKHHPKYAYGLQFRHLSAGEVAYFEETRHLIQLHGKLFTETLRMEGEMDCHRDGYQLSSLGNSTSAVPRRQTLQQFAVHNTLSNFIRGMFNYQVGASFYYLADAYQAREHQWEFNGRGDYTLNDALTLKAFTDLYLTKHSDTTAVQRNLWWLKPMLFFMLNSFDVQRDVNLVYQDDVSYASDAVNVYPVLEVKYALYKWLRPYVGICGDIRRNSLQGFLQENPLLAPQVILSHTNQHFMFLGGLEAMLRSR